MPRWAGELVLRAPRVLVATLLAFVPALVLFVFAALGPEAFRVALTDAANVHDAFKSFVSGVATASSIAVSVAVFTMRRDLKGIQSHEERQEEADQYRRGMRAGLDRRELPVHIGPFLAATLEGIAGQARQLIDRLPQSALGLKSDGIRLGEMIEGLHEQTGATAARLRKAAGKPDELHLISLDVEQEKTTRLLHRVARDERLSEDERRELAELRDLFREFVLVQRLLTTLDTQWSLRRMSVAILVSTLPGVVTAAVMTLTFGQGAVETLGEHGAALLVCVALGIVLFPLACFVSYLLRFLLISQQSIPSTGFLLGPERPGEVG